MTPAEIERELFVMGRSQAHLDQMILETYAGDGDLLLEDEEGSSIVPKAEMRELVRFWKEREVARCAQFCREHGIRAVPWPTP